MKDYLKAAILGMGNMGKAHADSIMKMQDVELVALCSQPKADAAEYAEEHKITCAIYENAYEMIEKEELDVLYICLPPFAHNGQLEAAAKKGIHIFIEKPIAMTVQRAESMAEAVRVNGVFSQVGYHMRFGGAVERFKELLTNGTAGKPVLYTASYECNSLHGEWWREIDKCGGQVFEQVIHLYDMGIYLMGEAKAVNGYTANLCHGQVEGYTIEDTSISNIIFKNGSLGSICGTNCAVKNEWNARFRVVCENMVADFKDYNHAEFIYTSGDETVKESVETKVNATFEEDCYFMDVIRKKKLPRATVEEGFAGIKLVSGVLESSKKNGTAINICN